MKGTTAMFDRDEGQPIMSDRHIGYDTLGEEVDLDPRGYCVHGVYVGGCGADYMCGHCEMGEDTLVYHDVAQVAVFGTGVNDRFVTHVEPPTTIANAIKSAMFWQNAFEESNVDTMHVCINEYEQAYWTDGKDN